MTGKNATEVLGSDEPGIARAAAILRAGGLVALPTETVYGLAARADRSDAVAKIYSAKGRPDFNPLIVHVVGIEHAQRIARFDDRARLLAAHFWPGPLTLVLPLAEQAGLAPAVSAGLPTIGLRVPEHPIMHAVLHQTEVPLAAPSANRSGSVSPTDAAHVLSTLDGRIDGLVDAGPTGRGLESTIVALRDDGSWQLLRPGPIAHEELVELLGPSQDVKADKVEAPGQLARHYAPGKPLRLDARYGEEDEYLIGFGEIGGDTTLSASGDLAEAASRLFACLHQAATSERARIAVAPVPEQGVGRAINDRLRRAAA